MIILPNGKPASDQPTAEERLGPRRDKIIRLNKCMAEGCGRTFEDYGVSIICVSCRRKFLEIAEANKGRRSGNMDKGVDVVTRASEPVSGTAIRPTVRGD
jgi:hypothetical protein